MPWVGRRIKDGVFWLSALAGVVMFLLRGRKPKPGLAILCYHRMAENLPTGAPFDPYNVTPKRFSRQLDALQSMPGIKVVSVAEVAGWTGMGKAPEGSYLLVTFDDGYQNTLAAAHQLHARAMKGVFFLTTGYLGRPVFECNLYDQWCRQLPSADPRWYRPLTWEDCQTLLALGMDLQPHGHWHRLLGRLERADMKEEIVASMALTEGVLGCKSIAYAYVGGSSYLNHFNPRVEGFLSQIGFQFALSTDAGSNRLSELQANAYHLRRIPIHEHDRGLFFQAKVAGYCGPLPAMKAVAHRLRARFASLFSASPRNARGVTKGGQSS
jgi:peptidoglycan/xylan/chitin deacetylase (PgdA/CDA1 family)